MLSNGLSWIMIFNRVIALYWKLVSWKIVFGLFLSNLWFDFGETSWEVSSKKMRILNCSSWMIFSRVIALCWKIVLGLFLSNYFFDFNETLWEAFSLREDGHIIKWFQLNDFHQSYCPFLKNLFWGYFSVTIRLITTKLHGNFSNLETMRILLWNGSS